MSRPAPALILQYTGSWRVFSAIAGHVSITHDTPSAEGVRDGRVSASSAGSARMFYSRRSTKKGFKENLYDDVR